jgi:hypothetical protein
MVIALLATVSFMYCTPFIAMALKLTGLLQFKLFCWMVLGIFAYANINFIRKKYSSEIHHAVDYVMTNDLRKIDRVLIALLAFFSFPFLTGTMWMLKSMNYF